MNASDATDSDNLLESLHEESDRGMVIVAASYADNLLEDLHRIYIKRKITDKRIVDKLFGSFGPLSTFSGRISLAYAYGVIDRDIFENLEILRKMRNRIAHEPGSFKLTDSETAKLVHKLTANNIYRIKNGKIPRSGILSKNTKEVFLINYLSLTNLILEKRITFSMNTVKRLSRKLKSIDEQINSAKG